MPTQRRLPNYDQVDWSMDLKECQDAIKIMDKLLKYMNLASNNKVITSYMLRRKDIRREMENYILIKEYLDNNERAIIEEALSTIIEEDEE